MDYVKKEYGVKNDNDLNAEGIRKVVDRFKETYKKATQTDFPQDVNKQLEDCIETVFSSWESPRAKVYRQLNAIPDNYGTAGQCEDVVAGIKQTKQIGDLKTEMPEVYKQLVNTINKLEKHAGYRIYSSRRQIMDAANQKQ